MAGARSEPEAGSPGDLEERELMEPMDIDPNMVIGVQQNLINQLQEENLILQAAVKGLLAEKYAAQEGLIPEGAEITE